MQQFLSSFIRLTLTYSNILAPITSCSNCLNSMLYYYKIPSKTIHKLFKTTQRFPKFHWVFHQTNFNLLKHIARITTKPLLMITSDVYSWFNSSWHTWRGSERKLQITCLIIRKSARLLKVTPLWYSASTPA